MIGDQEILNKIVKFKEKSVQCHEIWSVGLFLAEIITYFIFALKLLHRKACYLFYIRPVLKITVTLFINDAGGVSH